MRIVYTRREHTEPVHDSWNLSSVLCPKVYIDWHLKTSLDPTTQSQPTGEHGFDTAPGAQARVTGKRLLQTYRYDYLKAEPKMIWSPAEAFEAEYHATISYGGSKIGNDTHLAPLLDFVQRMHLTFSIGHVDLCLSGEHYRNDLRQRYASQHTVCRRITHL